MSRLDEILKCMQVEEYGTVSRADTKQAIKELMLEIIDTKHEFTGSYDPYAEMILNLKTEQRKRLEEM